MTNATANATANVHQVARALVRAGHPIIGAAHIAAELLRRGLDAMDVDVDVDHVVLPGYVACDESRTRVYYEDARDAQEAADTYVDDGSFPCEESYAVVVSTWRRALTWDGLDVDEVERDHESVLVTRHPSEPECVAVASGEHEWIAPVQLVGGCRENPGCWGTGGCGLRIVHVCAYCGLSRIERTASQPYASEYDHDTIDYGTDDADVDDLAAYHIDEGDADYILGAVADDAPLALAIRERLMSESA